MPESGPWYSYGQLEQLWINAGGSTDTAPVAAAIAEAESSGGAGSINPTDNNGSQTSWGLWQISDGTHNQPVPNILDPTVNAQQAVGKYRASGWSPWGTYTSGAWKSTYQANVAPDPSNVPAGTGGGSGASGSATLTSSTSSAGASPATLTGIAGFLQTLDGALNPAGPSAWSEITSLGTAGVGSAIELLVVRGFIAAGFMLVTYFGIKQFTGGGGSRTIIQIAQAQKRISQEDTRLSQQQERIRQSAARHNLNVEKEVRMRGGPAPGGPTGPFRPGPTGGPTPPGPEGRLAKSALTAAKDFVEGGL